MSPTISHRKREPPQGGIPWTERISTATDSQSHGPMASSQPSPLMEGVRDFSPRRNQGYQSASTSSSFDFNLHADSTLIEGNLHVAGTPTSNVPSRKSNLNSHGDPHRAMSSSEEGGVESSCGGSSGGHPITEGSSSGALHQVTATATTTSSGDDRDSSHQDKGSTEGHFPSNNSSGSDDQDLSGLVMKMMPTERHHYHAHHDSASHYHHRGRAVGTCASNSVRTADEFGLPVPLDAALQAKNISKHATVVAHLPPPHHQELSCSTSSGSGGEGDREVSEKGVSLLPPHPEPAFHTIRRTFNKLVRRGEGGGGHKSSETDSSSDPPRHLKKHKPTLTRKTINELSAKRPQSEVDFDDVAGSGSGSGTEGGYAGSASSNENGPQAGSCSSPSVSSNECHSVKRSKSARKSNAATGFAAVSKQFLSSKKQGSNLSSSSDIADFGTESSVESQSISSSSPEEGSSDEQAERVTRDPVHGALLGAPGQNRARSVRRATKVLGSKERAAPARFKSEQTEGLMIEGKPPILCLGCDIMAHVLTFLEPPCILEVLTMPLSRDWLTNFTKQPELWRVLCLLDPFKAQVDREDDDSDDSVDSDPFSLENDLKRTFGKYRLLYTSFVRCMRYLSRIREDAASGRTPSVSEYPRSNQETETRGANQSLYQFLARAQGIVIGRAMRGEDAERLSGSDISDDDDQGDPVVQQVAKAEPIGLSDDGSSTSVPKKRRNPVGDEDVKKRKHAKFGHSTLTQRLLGPAATGEVGEMELPWSCAVYSLVNWMSAFSDVEGIQTMCLRVLPLLLENEQQRIAAQRAGLTNIVLRGMVAFPDSSTLHIAAFHALVLLARPLGGREGMLFHSSMVNSSGIFSATTDPEDGRNGISVMLHSMRRFQHDEVLQAMSCWSLVNIALDPVQKLVLVRLGGLEATVNSMMQHPFSAEVQFRALFALINLVIPANNTNHDGQPADANANRSEHSEQSVLDSTVDQIINLVVITMKNFCSSEAILNRACLVLHNLSLSRSYHGAMLLTPNCYQMLEWCLANYRNDPVLQQSAAGTLHRLQIALAGDEALRARFTTSLQQQQQLSLERAHQEALLLHERQRALVVRGEANPDGP